MLSNRPVFSIPTASIEAIRQALGQGWDVVNVASPTTSDGDGATAAPEAVSAARGAEVYVGYGVPRTVVDAGRGTLRWAHSGTAGVGSTIPHMRGTGIVLTNSAGVHAEPLADFAVAGIAFFARGLDRMVEAQRARRWAKEDFTDSPRERELRDLRLGVFGLGGLGSAVAQRGLALGMRVAGVRRDPQRGGPEGVAWVGGPDDLERLASESDAFVIAAPRTGTTERGASREVLERLPENAIVVNLSRGALLDEAALLERLDSGWLRGAALDVFAVEPLPPEHRFWTHPRVLVSPHTAAATDRFWQRETDLIVENIRRYLAGTPLANVVDLEAGY